MRQLDYSYKKQKKTDKGQLKEIKRTFEGQKKENLRTYLGVSFREQS